MKKRFMTLSVLGLTAALTFGGGVPVTAFAADEAVVAEAADTQQTGVSVDNDFVVLTGTGVTHQIKVNAPEGATVQYKTNNRKSATVDKNGLVTATGYGLADITVQVRNGNDFNQSFTVKVTVVPEKETAPHVKMGLQMYNFLAGGDFPWSGATKDQVIDLLRQLAADGYEGLEWVNLSEDQLYPGVSNKDIKDAIDKLGLKTISVHFWEQYINTPEKAKKAVKTAQELGSDSLVFAYSGPSMYGIKPDANGKYTAEQGDQYRDGINKQLDLLKEAAKGTGLKVIYHNHNNEFLLKTTNGNYVEDELTPDMLEMDYFWATKGIGSVNKAMDYVKQHASKIQMFHVKDGSQDTSVTNDYITWGHGSFNIQELIDVARKNSNIKWAIAEDDNPYNAGLTGLEDAQESINYAKQHIRFNYTKDDSDSKFSDVADSGKYYYQPVYWAVNHGVASGKSNTVFAPGDPCTREQIVTFLWNAAGKPEANAGTKSFRDVKPGRYYEKAVKWAVSKGITSGVSDTEFGVGQTCTREQAVTFLYKAMNSPEVSSKTAFADVKDGAYYAKAVKWAADAGITKGNSATKFGVGDPCTRGQIITFLFKTYNK